MMPRKSPSLVLCGSVISTPDASYLSRLRATLIYDQHLTDLRNEVSELFETWPLLVERQPLLRSVRAFPFLQSLSTWVHCGDTSALLLVGAASKNTQSAVLTVLSHILEYVSFLNSTCGYNEGATSRFGDPHACNLENLLLGGIQGLCMGLLSAIAISISQKKTDLGKYGAIAIRLALCIGAFVDLDEAQLAEPCVCISASWLSNDELQARMERMQIFESSLDREEQVGVYYVQVDLPDRYLT